MKKRAEIKISGEVQGVGFRFYVSAWAKDYGIKGWAKNTIDGGVKVVCEGEEDRLQEFVGALKKGPVMAKLDNVKVNWVDPKNEFSDFKIKY